VEPDNWVFDRLPLAAGYADKGDTVKPAAARTELQKRMPGYSISIFKAGRCWDHPAFLRQAKKRLFPGLRKAGVPEN
jgi:hypothetical protein